MRMILAILAIAFPIAATAQPAPMAPPGAGGRAISRDQFVQRAAEMAGRRFDAIDTNHTGSVTRAQIRAYRDSHAGDRAGQARLTE